MDSSNSGAILQKELLPDQQESISFYSDDSTDKYKIDETDSAVLDTKDLNQTSIVKSNSSIDLAAATPVNENDEDSSSVSSSSLDSTSYFEKPMRTYSEDTILTPPIKPPSNKEAINKEEDEEEDATTIASPIRDRPPSQSESRQSTSTISSFSDLKEILSSEQNSSTPVQDKEVEDEKYNPLKIITSALVSGEKPQITPVPVPTRFQPKSVPSPPSKDAAYYESLKSPFNQSPSSPPPIQRHSMDNISVASAPAARSIFTLWSPFRSSTSTSTSPPSSRRLSKQNTAPSINTTSIASRPSASFTARQTKLSRPTSVISPLPGFQETLLAQMEQLNVSNTNDPKSKMIKNLKRQSIRHSLVSQNKGDDYDWDFWAGIMCDFQTLNKVDKDLIKQIRFGIPPSIRGMVWQLLAKSKDEDLVAKYMDLLRLPSPYDKMIQRDLARTFPGHTYFKETDGQGQEGLYNVVRAYSLYDTEVGYCQGLAFIVGPMLLNMPDEDAFCVLIQLMNQYDLRGHFTPDMDGLQMRLYQFDALVQEHLPHVARHLKQQGINSTMYASQWFMTLFAYKFPLNLVYRIYDVIFAEGINSIFKFAIALLKRNQTTILGSDFEHLLDFLKNGLFEEYKDDDRRFVGDACELEFPAKRLQQLEKEHKALLQKELADANIIDELQKSNAEMQNQLKALETKTQTLKQEHSDVNSELQNTLQQLNTLKDEGSSLSTLVSSLQKAVDELPEKIESKTKDQFEGLCSENALLIGRNSTLEDQLQKAEATLIDIKIRYAQSENDNESLHQRLYELKKLMSF
ncbi:hypothetical protein [Parasitella parasitica]|uniref:Rab-GAP TBC domain-containing protein n=1 Tax=Parasitella parasitica TaxID=35722 RepID=A0A0B7NKF4_9FUNG|nr:hypothetical protein [Parasitella parasitica]